MSVVREFESQDAAQVAPTFTLRPKPDRRKAPRVVVGPGMDLECYITGDPQPVFVVSDRERSEVVAVL